jgi:hypothetical protein
MVVRPGLLILGLFHLANGLAMLAAPEAWAARVVHLTAPDHLHHHFIADIAMAFLASGIGLMLATRRGASAAWAAAGATWPALHALLHVKDWLLDGPPAAMGDLINEGLGVVVAGAAGAVLAWLRTRQEA